MDNGFGSNIIIAEPSKNLRTLGRNALENRWKKAILALLVFTLIIEVPPAILNALFGMNITDFYSDAYVLYNYVDSDYYGAMYSSLPVVSPLSYIYLLLVEGPLTLGISLFFLGMFRRHIVEVSDIFLGFEKFTKAIGLFVVMGIFICLWTLLFIIPGIIAALRYSQAFFILADDPSKGIMQCINESKEMMKGNKWKFFCLELSFIGWMILASLPGGIIESFGVIVGADEVTSAVLSVVGGLFAIPVTVYMMSSYVGFYEIAAGHLIKKTEPAPIDDDSIIRADIAASVQEELAPIGEASKSSQVNEQVQDNLTAQADEDKSDNVQDNNLDSSDSTNK